MIDGYHLAVVAPGPAYPPLLVFLAGIVVGVIGTHLFPRR